MLNEVFDAKTRANTRVIIPYRGRSHNWLNSRRRKGLGLQRKYYRTEDWSIKGGLAHLVQVRNHPMGGDDVRSATRHPFFARVVEQAQKLFD